MKLITYKSDDNEGIGSLELDKIIPFGDDPSLPTDMLSFLEAGESAADKATADAAAAAAAAAAPKASHDAAPSEAE